MALLKISCFDMAEIRQLLRSYWIVPLKCCAMQTKISINCATILMDWRNVWPETMWVMGGFYLFCRPSSPWLFHSCQQCYRQPRFARRHSHPVQYHELPSLAPDSHEAAAIFPLIFEFCLAKSRKAALHCNTKANWLGLIFDDTRKDDWWSRRRISCTTHQWNRSQISPQAYIIPVWKLQ